MKKYCITLFTTLALISCKNDEVKEEFSDLSYKPISNLEIPREAKSGTEVTMTGTGFQENCKIYLKQNGSTKKISATIVQVTSSSLTFLAPSSIEMGFYSIILFQNDTNYTIGAINISIDSFDIEDYEFYAIVGSNQEFAPTSFSNQTKGNKIENTSTIQPESYLNCVIPFKDGRNYYTSLFTTFESGRYKMGTRHGYINLATGENQKIEEIPNFIAMGNIDEELYILTTSNNVNYTLINYLTSETIKQFVFPTSQEDKIFENDFKFEYHQSSSTILISGNMGKGENVGYVTFSLNLNSGEVFKNGGDSKYAYWFAIDGKDDLYCFARELNDYAKTTIYQINNPLTWNVYDANSVTQLATISKSGFDAPIYSEKTGLIYGFDDIDECNTILAFNPLTKKTESKKWIKPSIAYMFYSPFIKE